MHLQNPPFFHDTLGAYWRHLHRWSPQVTSLKLTSSSRVETESLSFAVDWKSYPEQFDKRRRNQEGRSRSCLLADVALHVGTCSIKVTKTKVLLQCGASKTMCRNRQHFLHCWWTSWKTKEEEDLLAKGNTVLRKPRNTQQNGKTYRGSGLEDLPCENVCAGCLCQLGTS